MARRESELLRAIVTRERIFFYYMDATLDLPMNELAMIRKQITAIGYNINQMTHRFHDVNGRMVLEQTGYIQRPPPAAIGDWYWSGQGETVYYTYDENSQKKTYTDSHGRRTSYEYDSRNRLWNANLR